MRYNFILFADTAILLVVKADFEACNQRDQIFPNEHMHCSTWIFYKKSYEEVQRAILRLMEAGKDVHFHVLHGQPVMYEAPKELTTQLNNILKKEAT